MRHGINPVDFTFCTLKTFHTRDLYVCISHELKKTNKLQCKNVLTKSFENSEEVKAKRSTKHRVLPCVCFRSLQVTEEWRVGVEKEGRVATPPPPRLQPPPNESITSAVWDFSWIQEGPTVVEGGNNSSVLPPARQPADFVHQS